MRFSMQCKLIVENHAVKQSQFVMSSEPMEEEEKFELPANVFREINDIKDEFMVLSRLIFKILNKRKGVDNSTFLSQLF